MKYVVRVTETFDKLIVVEADNEREAIDKCWDEHENTYDIDSPVFFDYLKDYSEKNFEIANEEDRERVMEHIDWYDWLGWDDDEDED